MKKALFFAGLAAAALSFAGCNKEADLAGNGTPVRIVLTNPDTRTVNDGLKTNWVEGDALNVFYAAAGTTDYSSNVKFTVDDAATGHATGTAELTADAYDWYLLYPYESHIKTPANTSAGYLTIGSAANGKQAQTGLNNMAHLAGGSMPVYGQAKNIATGTTPEVAMKQVASVVAVNVTNATSAPLAVSSVTFTAPEDIVGTYYIDFAGEQLAFKGSGNNYVSKSATLDVTGDETIAAGASAKFYIAVKPFTAAASSELAVKVMSGEKVFEKKITLPAAVTFNSGIIKQLNVQYTGGSEIQASSLADIIAMDDGTDMETQEVLVVGKYTRGIMLGQNGTYLLAFNNGGVDGAVGDIVTVAGKVGSYGGLKQITSPVVTVVSSGNQVVLPDPKVLESLDDYESNKVEMIQYTGTLKVSGNYINVAVEGSTRMGSIQYPIDDLSGFANKQVVATGFFTGISGSSTKYVNMMSTSVEETDANVFEVTPSQIDVAATATTATINVAGNVDWTAEVSAGASVNPASGSGNGTITVSFPANEDTENEKEYVVFVRTEATGVNDEFEVDITQAKAVDGTVLFNETFDKIEGTGGRDGVYSGSVASSDFKDTDEEWTDVSKMYGAKQCAKYGTSSANGTMTTRAITLTGEAVLSFEAAGWGSGTNTLEVTATGATLSGNTSITLTNGAWSTYSIPVTGASGSFTLTFSGKRGFIDEIKVISGGQPPVAAALVSIAVSGQKTVFNVDDTFTLGSGKVTATYDDGSTKDVTASVTNSNPDMTTAGTKEVTLSYTEGGNTKTTSYQITVNAAVTPTHAGTEADPYTVAEALSATLALGEGNTSSDSYYTKGIISEIVEISTQHGNGTYYISDDGTTTSQFEVFRGKYIGNINFTATDQIQVGDEVVVYGKFTYYKNTSTPEIAQNNYITSLKRNGTAVYAMNAVAASTSIGAAGGAIKVNVYGNVSWTGTVTAPASIDTNTGSGVGSFNLSVPANDTGAARTFTVTVSSANAATVTIQISQDAAGSGAGNEYVLDLTTATYSSQSEDQVVWDTPAMTITVSKADAGTNANNYLGGDAGNHTSSRFYKGSKVTFAPKSGVTVTSMVCTATSESYATAFAGSTWSNATAAASSSTITVRPTSGANAVEVTIGGTCGFKQIVINY